MDFFFDSSNLATSQLANGGMKKSKSVTNNPNLAG